MILSLHPGLEAERRENGKEEAVAQEVIRVDKPCLVLYFQSF